MNGGYLMAKIQSNITLLVLFLLIFVQTVGAGNTATQNINITVSTINEISLSTNDVNLIVNAPSSGSTLHTVSDSSTTISYSTNETNQKITATLDKNLPIGLTLLVEATSTSGTSAGQVMLEDRAVDVITGLSNVSESGETITYTLIPDMYAVPTTESYTITYTITSS
jgi:hypothetical protein